MKQTDGLQIGHSPDKEKDFKIACDVMGDKRMEVPFSHRHHFYAVYWIHEGNGVHTIDFEEYEIRPDRIFFIRPEQIHFLHDNERVRYSALQFTEDFMMPFYPTASGEVNRKEIAVYKDLSDAEQQRIAVLFRQLQAESVSNLPHSAELIRSEINTLLLELERISLATLDTSSVPDLLRTYKDLIDKQFMDKRQVQYYAAQLSISPNYLNVLTRKHCGRTALDLINERVLLEVKRLLLRTDLAISEIAWQSGFNELSYFSRFFKRHTGMTPVQFREAMNKMYQT